MLDTINSNLYEVVHAAFYCNVYYAAVVQTKIFNGQEYKKIPKKDQKITAMIIDTKTQKKEFIYLNLEKESDIANSAENVPKLFLICCLIRMMKIRRNGENSVIKAYRLRESY